MEVAPIIISVFAAILSALVALRGIKQRGESTEYRARVDATLKKHETDSATAITRLKHAFEKQESEVAHLRERTTVDWRAAAEVRVKLTLEDVDRAIKMNGRINDLHKAIQAPNFDLTNDDINRLLATIRDYRASVVMLPKTLRAPCTDILRRLAVLGGMKHNDGGDSKAHIFKLGREASDARDAWHEAVSEWRDELLKQPANA